MRTLVFITPQFGASAGGIGISAERIVGHLRQDYDVAVIVPDCSVPAGATRIESGPGLSVLRFGVTGDRHQLRQSCSDLVTERLLHDIHSAAIGFHVSDPAYAAVSAARFIGRPVFLFARGGDVDRHLSDDEACFVRYSLKNCDHTFCVTSELEGIVRGIAPNTMTSVISNGVDSAMFSFQKQYEPASRPVLGVYAGICSRSALEFFLNHIDLETWKVRIFGAPPETRVLCRFPEGLLSDDRIELVPMTRDMTARREHYWSLDVLCLPSSHRGIPNVLLEAMSCGKVCVAPDIGGVGHILRHGENGFLFRLDDGASLRTALGGALDACRCRAHRMRLAAHRTAAGDLSHAREREAYRCAFREWSDRRARVFHTA